LRSRKRPVPCLRVRRQDKGIEMKIAFKLFASLTDYLPPERRGNRIELEVPADTTIADMIARYRVPEKSAHLVLVNGVFVPPEQRPTRRLAEGDELAVWPPIAGG
jgi:sulfur carrier protein ThiS